MARDEAGRPGGGIARLRAEAAGCRRCPLFANATQTVFGEGPEDARLVVVGEQPGDSEDRAGRPFVGPAGGVFDEAAEAAGLDRSEIYVTNAVKHFKFEPRGKRRLHKKPSAGEIAACRWWLDLELETIGPELVVGMGGTAVASLVGRPVKITAMRGSFFETAGGLEGFATLHPSAILRLPDKALRAKARATFVDDLKRVAERLAG